MWRLSWITHLDNCISASQNSKLETMTYTGEGGGVGGWEEVVLDKRQGFADQGGGLRDKRQGFADQGAAGQGAGGLPAPWGRCVTFLPQTAPSLPSFIWLLLILRSPFFLGGFPSHPLALDALLRVTWHPGTECISFSLSHPLIYLCAYMYAAVCFSPRSSH